MKIRHQFTGFTVVVFAAVMAVSLSGQRRSEFKLSQGGPSDHHDDDGPNDDRLAEGRRLFEKETFGGNGRTCLTCHSRKTGTVSPDDARERYARDADDPLVRAAGSED